MMSWAVFRMSTAWRKPSTSNSPPSLRNCNRLSEARLHADSSRCMYSEHGFDALMRPLFGHVCQSLMVLSNCMPGSPQTCVDSAIWRSRSRAFIVSATCPSSTLRVCRAVERGIVAGGDQGPCLLLFVFLAAHEVEDVGMVGVENAHLGRAPRLAARLDHAGRASA